MLKTLTTTFLILFALSSCGNDVKKADDTQSDKKNDTIQKVNTAPIKKDTVISKKVEAEVNKAKIVEKYGEQWDFCSCIVKNDSITDAFEKKLTPAQEEKLMARWEYVDTRCKELTTNPATTPEERDRHERKVKKCLKANGLKK